MSYATTVDELRAEVRYRRTRLQLHRAKVYAGKRLHDPRRVGQLERELQSAQSRLDLAKAREA